MRTNQEYKNAALAALKRNWPQAVVATFIVMLLTAISESSELVQGKTVLVVSLGLCVFALPVIVAYVNAFNRLYYQSDRALLDNMSSMTFKGYFRSLATMFLMCLIVSVLTLLLIIPGIMANMAFYLTPYILKDNPELSILDTLRLSRKMMQGHKMRLFCLQLSFLGWILLSVLTLGIGMLWLLPYMMTTMSAFYQDVREQYIMKEGQQESAL
jgi:uncharacterized membrane protein